MTLAQEVRRGDEVLVTADVMVAAVRDGRAVRIPDDLRAALSAALLGLMLPCRAPACARPEGGGA